jgi:hypothetical protein
MPVASYQRVGELIGPKGFPAPKVSTLMHWYRAAYKVLPELPHWTTVIPQINQAVVDLETIVWELPEGTLFVARKRNLR